VEASTGIDREKQVYGIQSGLDADYLLSGVGGCGEGKAKTSVIVHNYDVAPDANRPAISRDGGILTSSISAELNGYVNDLVPLNADRI
jgi:hypothetical protein